MTGSDLFGPLGRRERLAVVSPLEVGRCYTCSPNVLTNDRSFSQSVWEVLDFNTLHVRVRWAGGAQHWHRDLLQPILLFRQEHEFAEAPAGFIEAGGPA